MTRFALISFLALFSTACTEVPPPPDGGTGGASGSGGVSGMGGVGGVGGRGGSGGVGGTLGVGGHTGVGGGGGADPCAVVVPQPMGPPEEGDGANEETKTAIGSVRGDCSDLPLMPCTGDDPIDRWSITTCGGKHSIELTWDDISSDLDLFLLDSMDREIDDSSSQNTTSETIVADNLADGALYIIQVQAYEVPIGQTYQLSVRRTD